MAGKQIFGLLTRPGMLAKSHGPCTTIIRQYAARPGTRVAYNQIDAERGEHHQAMERNFTRDWEAGSVYAPHDLSAAEARKWKAKTAPTTDVFDSLSIKPLECYKNFSIMSEYVTELGRIRPRSQTGLRRVNQRKLAKAIRRAVALGLMPSVHRHPEIIKYDMTGFDGNPKLQ